jgi:hypothetical protein
MSMADELMTLIAARVSHLSCKILTGHGQSGFPPPPYHSKLDPPELIWATVKNWVADSNATFRMEDVKMRN